MTEDAADFRSYVVNIAGIVIVKRTASRIVRPIGHFDIVSFDVASDLLVVGFRNGKRLATVSTIGVALHSRKDWEGAKLAHAISNFPVGIPANFSKAKASLFRYSVKYINLVTPPNRMILLAHITHGE